jgi:hypothetical protein
LAREKRIKDQKKTALREEIIKLVVSKGEVKNPSTNFELHDIHASLD